MSTCGAKPARFDFEALLKAVGAFLGLSVGGRPRGGRFGLPCLFTAMRRYWVQASTSAGVSSLKRWLEPTKYSPFSRHAPNTHKGLWLVIACRTAMLAAMNITWSDSSGRTITGRIDASLWPYIEVLGLDPAARLFLQLGGSWVYIPGKRSNSAVRSGTVTKLAAVLGPEALKRVQELPGAGGRVRVPLAPNFLARYLRSRGQNIGQIAARLRMADVTVANHLRPDDVRRAATLNLSDRFREAAAYDVAAEHENHLSTIKGTSK